jgi:coenzyme F420-reducing hydrogenase beta subunit
MNRISNITPQECCGCAACEAICPNDCIRMTPDQEGFSYVEVNPRRCIDCGLCRMTCPCLNPVAPNIATSQGRGAQTPATLSPPHPYPEVYAAWNLDPDIRRQSSSGGVFTALAENIIGRGGVVVGAAFDEECTTVSHVAVENQEGLAKLRGSKYVQSHIAPKLYQQIKCLLNEGRHLLFSGTPCQVTALRRFLRKSYPNLLTCDFICHGVPSPTWLTTYLSQEPKKVKSLRFREKVKGWKTFKMRLTFDDGSIRDDGMYDNAYLCSFRRDYSLRPSCYTCKFTSPLRSGDITLADFWGVSTKYPDYDRDDQGTSLILVNNASGKTWIETCRPALFLGAADLATAITGNPMLARPAPRPLERDTFYKDLALLSFSQFRETYRLFASPSRPLWRRAGSFIKRYVKQIAQGPRP